MADATKVTITELVRRLNHVPPETSRSLECAEIQSGEDVITITIPAKVFADAGLLFMLPECGLHGERGAE